MESPSFSQPANNKQALKEIKKFCRRHVPTLILRGFTSSSIWDMAKEISSFARVGSGAIVHSPVEHFDFPVDANWPVYTFDTMDLEARLVPDRPGINVPWIPNYRINVVLFTPASSLDIAKVKIATARAAKDGFGPLKVIAAIDARFGNEGELVESALGVWGIRNCSVICKANEHSDAVTKAMIFRMHDTHAQILHSAQAGDTWEIAQSIGKRPEFPGGAIVYAHMRDTAHLGKPSEEEDTGLGMPRPLLLTSGSELLETALLRATATVAVIVHRPTHEELAQVCTRIKIFNEAHHKNHYLVILCGCELPKWCADASLMMRAFFGTFGYGHSISK